MAFDVFSTLNPSTPAANPGAVTTPTPTPAAAPTTQTQPDVSGASTPQPSTDNGSAPTAPQTSSASAPARTFRRGGMFEAVLTGALRGAVDAGKATQKAGRVARQRANNFVQNSPYAQQLKDQALQRQAKQQQMTEDAQKSVDEHTESILRANGMSMDNMHKAAENHHLESMYPLQEEEARNTLIGQIRTQNDADRKLLTTLEEIGINLDTSHFTEGNPFAQLTQDHANEIANGRQIALSNGLTGPDADLAFVSNQELANTVLPHDIQVVTDWNLDPKTGEMTPVNSTLTGGKNTALDAVIAHDAGMDKFNQKQDMFQKQLQAKQAALTAIEPKNAPKTLGEATAAFTYAQQAYRNNPNDETRVAFDRAREMRDNFLSDDAAHARLDQEATEGDPSSVAQMLVDGTVAPSQLPGRFRPQYISSIYAKAEQLAQQQGKTFNPARAEAQYNYAKNSQTQNTLNMIEGMTEDGGSIDIARQAAGNLPQLDFQTANKVFNATATQFGSPEATNFHIAMLGLADEYAKVMGGGVASDTGRQQALDILQQNYSRGQLQQGIKILQQDIEARKRAIVGDNPALLAMYGGNAQPNVPTSPQGLTNLQINPQTNQTIGWNGKAWVDAKTGEALKPVAPSQQISPIYEGNDIKVTGPQK